MGLAAPFFFDVPLVGALLTICPSGPILVCGPGAMSSGMIVGTEDGREGGGIVWPGEDSEGGWPLKCPLGIGRGGIGVDVGSVG